MKHSDVRHEVTCTEPSERLRQAVRLLYEYVLERKHASSMSKHQTSKHNAHEDAQRNHLQPAQQHEQHNGSE